MVYSLNIVSADEILYAAEPLDGDVGAIRATNSDPDGGVNFKGYNSGRRCQTDHFPTRMLWKGPKGSIIGDFNRQNVINISESAKALIEQFEPGKHQFVPLDFVDNAGHVLERRYALVICERLDSVDRDRTTFVLLRGKMWRAAATLLPDHADEIPPHIDPTKPGKFVFSRSQIGSNHIWRDKHMDLGDVLISDAFAGALRTSGLTGTQLSDEGMETV